MNGKEKKKFTGAYGNVVVIYHGRDIVTFAHIYTLYAHLDERSVSWNEKVKLGQTIGTSGRSGTRQGYYNWKGGYGLHFEVLKAPRELTSAGLIRAYANKDLYRKDPERFLRSTFVVAVDVSYFEGWKGDHYNRNMDNLVDPEEIYEIIEEKNGWFMVGFVASKYHRQGSESEIYHWKYVNKDGREAVLDNNKKLIESPLNKGTFNHGKWIGGHFTKDMIPYIFWGNSPDDPSSPKHRIVGNYHTK